MNSRERIIAAIEHREPDKVPLDLGATPSSGISVIGYNKLKKHLGITSGRTLVYDVVQQLAQPEDEILDRFQVDVVDVGRMFNSADEDWYPIQAADGSEACYPRWFHPRLGEDGSWNAYSLDDEDELLATMPRGATFFDQTVFPWVDDYPDSYDNLAGDMNKIMWAHFAHSPWDNAREPDFWTRLRERCLALRQQTDRAIMVVCGCNLFEWGTFLRRIDNFLMDLVAEPENVEAFLEVLMPVHMKTLENVCQAVGDVADIVRFGDDLGMNTGPFMSPEVYRRLFKPRHTMLCEYVKANSSMKTFLHCCGSIYKLLPDLIEAGYDVINPVQTNAAGMDPATLKKEFGDDICFWGGGADTRSVLNHKSAQEVRDHVRERLDLFAPGGGFVFNTVHNIMPDVPPENIVAMYETVMEY